MITRQPRTRDRSESREAAELRALRIRQPELAPAVDLQVELLDIHRRVLPRISLPATLLGTVMPDVRSDGRALLTWELVALEWAEFRAVLRETIDALLRSGDIEPGDAQFLTVVARDGNRLPAFIEAWFRDRIERRPGRAGATSEDLRRLSDGALDNALSLAFRPFFVRCADAVAPRLPLDQWQRGTCPLCGGDPEIGVLSEAGDHVLSCGRCGLRWPFSDHRCPYCENTDPSRLQTFTSRDRIYRLTACDVCRRYVKAYDERYAQRHAMPGVDAIAMLPLDALAIQRGYLA